MTFMVQVVQDGHQKPRQDRIGQDRTGQVKTGQNGCRFWWIFKPKLRRKNAIHPSKVTHGDTRRGTRSMPKPGQAEQGQGKARRHPRAGGVPAAGTPRPYKDGSPPGTPGQIFFLIVVATLFSKLLSHIKKTHKSWPETFRGPRSALVS